MRVVGSKSMDEWVGKWVREQTDMCYESMMSIAIKMFFFFFFFFFFNYEGESKGEVQIYQACGRDYMVWEGCVYMSFSAVRYRWEREMRRPGYRWFATERKPKLPTTITVCFCFVSPTRKGDPPPPHTHNGYNPNTYNRLAAQI